MTCREHELTSTIRTEAQARTYNKGALIAAVLITGAAALVMNYISPSSTKGTAQISQSAPAARPGSDNLPNKPYQPTPAYRGN